MLTGWDWLKIMPLVRAGGRGGGGRSPAQPKKGQALVCVNAHGMCVWMRAKWGGESCGRLGTGGGVGGGGRREGGNAPSTKGVTRLDSPAPSHVTGAPSPCRTAPATGVLPPCRTCRGSVQRGTRCRGAWAGARPAGAAAGGAVPRAMRPARPRSAPALEGARHEAGRRASASGGARAEKKKRFFVGTKHHGGVFCPPGATRVGGGVTFFAHNELRTQTRQRAQTTEMKTKKHQSRKPLCFPPFPPLPHSRSGGDTRITPSPRTNR